MGASRGARFSSASRARRDSSRSAWRVAEGRLFEPREAGSGSRAGDEQPAFATRTTSAIGMRRSPPTVTTATSPRATIRLTCLVLQLNAAAAAWIDRACGAGATR